MSPRGIGGPCTRVWGHLQTLVTIITWGIYITKKTRMYGLIFQSKYLIRIILLLLIITLV